MDNPKNVSRKDNEKQAFEETLKKCSDSDSAESPKSTELKLKDRPQRSRLQNLSKSQDLQSTFEGIIHNSSGLKQSVIPTSLKAQNLSGRSRDSHVKESKDLNSGSQNSHRGESSGHSSSRNSKLILIEAAANYVKNPQLDMKSFMNVDDGSNVTELSPILTCIRTLNESEALWQGGKSQCFKGVSLKELKDEVNISREDGFCFVVSLQDGSALYISSSITLHLGYPKDMLMGQCIMNFLHHNDHITFANHLTQGLNACFIQGKKDDSTLVPNSFFCRLRLYHGLKYGYGVSEKKTQYKPFKVTLHINDLIFDDICVEKSSTLCVRATATPVASVYTVPEEIPAMTSFSTRHTPSCHFSHVDASAIPYLGYLPQDMVGYSVFDFYHIDDMPQLKDIYELVIKEQGASFRSKPYRFKVQNGCYILLETEWSCFINPWSRKLEFVVGQHRVLKGPTDVNIFNHMEGEEIAAPEEILKESLIIQKEIKTLLSQPIKNVGAEKSKRICNKRKRDLAAFVYNCIDEDYRFNKINHTQMQIEDASNSDLDSVVMGDISPYRDQNDSSSDTPTNVQQLCYEENIERFFASQPKTYSDDSEEYNKIEKLSNQGSSGTSGNASKNQQSSPAESPTAIGNTKVQESGSNSSKGNNSSFTTGDSGYGKSTEKDQTCNPNTSQASSSCSQTWHDSIHKEKISSCLALTEETLSAHNRMNHKFYKHRKNKSSVSHNMTTFKDCTRLQQVESPTPHKKKCSRAHYMISKTSQTPAEDVKANQAKFNFVQPQPVINAGSLPTVTSVPQAIPNPNFSTYATHPYLFPTANAATATPTPVFIPVVYMGSMPYYPPISNMFQQPGVGPFWPCATMPTAPVPESAFLAPMQPPTSTDMYASTGPGLRVQSSGVTAASLVATTTTTIASGTGPLFKNSNECVIPQLFENRRNSSCASRGQISIETNDSDLFMDDSELSTPFDNGSPQSTEKTEDMDLESKCIPKDPSYPPPKNKLDLSDEITFRYQMAVPNLDDILKKDLDFLKSISQPDLVNKQLKMLQSEFAVENKMSRAADDVCMMDSMMLGLTPNDTTKEAQTAVTLAGSTSVESQSG